MSKRTAEEFLERFPNSLTNVGSLADIACPKCGSRGGFLADVSRIYFWDNAGLTLWQQDPVLDGCVEDGAWIECRFCEHSEEVSDFTINGLDALIKSKQA